MPGRRAGRRRNRGRGVHCSRYIFDRVAAPRPDFRKTWLLHTLIEPEIHGDTVVVSDRASHKLYSKTLLPQRAVSRRLGERSR